MILIWRFQEIQCGGSSGLVSAGFYDQVVVVEDVLDKGWTKLQSDELQ